MVLYGMVWYSRCIDDSVGMDVAQRKIGYVESAMKKKSRI